MRVELFTFPFQLRSVFRKRFRWGGSYFLFILLPLLCMGTCVFASAQPQQADLAVVGGRLIDGFGGPPVENAVILIAGNRIFAVGTEGLLKVPEEVSQVSAEGMTILPGLWESHGHLAHLAEGVPTEFQEKFPDQLAAIMESVARTTLMAGVTSFRDTGGPLEEQQRLRSRIEAGEIPGPRLFLAGPILRQAGPDENAPGDFSVRTPQEARNAVRKLVAMGVDQVKVYGFWEEENLKAVAEEAHRAGIGVDADVRHIRAYRTAIRAGVDRLHHVFTADPLSDYSDEDLRLLIRGEKPVGTGPSANILRGPYIVPTLEMRRAYVRAHSFPESVDHPRLKMGLPEEVYRYLRETWRNVYSIPWGIGAEERIQAARKKLRKFVAAGGREQLVAGCDAGAPLNFHSPLPREIANLVEAGLSPMEAIQSATLRPAQMQGKDEMLGTVTAGKLADLIIVDGDPLHRIELLQSGVVHVIKDGKLVR